MGRRLVLAGLLALSATTADAKPRWQELPLPPAMPAPTTRGEVDVSGAHIYYAIYGQGDPVILLHGGLGNSDHWSNQVPALADKFQVIVIDSRGHGRSTRAKGPISYDVMASDVIAVMDHLQLERASMVGWSDGGEVALKLGIQYPDRVEKLFVFGSNYDVNGSKKRSGTPPQTFMAYAAKCKTDYLRMSKTPRAYDTLVDYLLPIWRNPMGFTKDQLKSIQAPTMVADGDHDEVIVLDQVEEMSHLIPNGQFKVFTDASHFALWQVPAEFNKTLVEFLSSPLPTTSGGRAQP
ncbi:MAG: catD 3 [Myxococcales bacterium]|nr:catD 3 [Myxococcales bacterium]